jgi:hypothetical protein
MQPHFLYNSFFRQLYYCTGYFGFYQLQPKYLLDCGFMVSPTCSCSAHNMVLWSWWSYRWINTSGSKTLDSNVNIRTP